MSSNDIGETEDLVKKILQDRELVSLIADNVSRMVMNKMATKLDNINGAISDLCDLIYKIHSDDLTLKTEEKEVGRNDLSVLKQSHIKVYSRETRQNMVGILVDENEEMVCLSDEGIIQATVTDTIDTTTKKHLYVQLTPTKQIDTIFNEVGAAFNYGLETFELILQKRNGDTIILNRHKDKTLGEIGACEPNSRITVCPAKKKIIPLVVSDTAADDDLLLGASASPTMGEIPSSSTENNMQLMSVDFCGLRNPPPRMDVRPVIEPCNYVGLVNQAMTCYLNSLLQALYMTPEFRNALYYWEFDGQSQEKSIPFQLQKLFLNLQTSSKTAVETTDLTHSFGWDMQAAWEQHDIQELCRVMFDALEQTFKNTKQANLINDLYEGKMLDYVKCLECSTEKSREDTFLDIPLPVRPFGSNVAYNSVEEALRAFVQPETLDGNNQYFCEKCNKKCDAHKGLKFTKFPYLLTLHLKRFDFDYSTMHRIKLNDKVVFPETLNLNSFTPGIISMADDAIAVEERDTIVKCDDCSTTDSGSALDDESCQGTDISSTVNGQDDNCQDDDEGIDVSSGIHHHENEKNRLQEPKGPYIYELFSIMIHSGSASGGHYYAYIKDFHKDQWFCFNDQSVSRITEDDIRKTYGGGSQRGYYSGAYTSSTNAYMLMYRQVDKQRNCNVVMADEFPVHIKKLLVQMREKEENDRLAKEKENDMFKLKVYCSHPNVNQLFEAKLFLFVDTTLAEAASEAYEKLKLQDICSIEDCRLVTYNKLQDCIDCSFDRDDLKFCDIGSKVIVQQYDWFLEIKQPGTEFQVYKTGGVRMKVYVVNLETEEVTGPTNVRINAGETVREIKSRLAYMFDMDPSTIQLVQETYSNEPRHLEEDDVPIKFDPSCHGYKLYISNALDEDPDKVFIISKMHKVIDRFVHIICIDIVLPETDIGTLESLSIPPLDLNQNLERLEMAVGERVSNSSSLRVSPQPGNAVGDGIGDQSNSEDSSLSDSDRTLVGDAPGDCIGLLSSSSNSPADQHMASPSDPTEGIYTVEEYGKGEMNWFEEEMPEYVPRCTNYYFKVTIEQNGGSGIFSDEVYSKYVSVMVDKRMNLAKLKKYLEPYVGVSVEYFKVYRQYPHQDVEWSGLTDTLGSTKDGDKLIVKLGRVLRKNEFSGKIFHLTPNKLDVFTFLFDWIIAKSQTVGSVKKDILLQAKKQNFLDIPYNKCRLRKKNWKSPAKIYLDDQKFSDDIQISNHFELFLQEVSDSEKVTRPTQLSVFARRWCPATLTLKPFHEIVVDNWTLEELRQKISQESGIPEEHLDVAYVKSHIPCDMNVLDVPDLEWNPNVTSLEAYPLQVLDDGSVFIYRDNKEQLKEISQEERNDINRRENTRLGRFSTKTYSPKRERGLKIYLDTSPNKADDNVAD